jgi:hypothetical protein
MDTQVGTAMDVEAAKAHSNVALLLTLSGGFLDAFTFVGHGKVFANSMSGATGTRRRGMFHHSSASHAGFWRRVRWN